MGVLEGRLSPNNLHTGSLFNGKNWIFPIDKDKAFTWKNGEKVRFKIDSTGTNLSYLDWNFKGQHMWELISLKTDEEGLGPISWWL